MEENEFTHVGIRKRTQKQISILARVFSNNEKVKIYDLVGRWADAEWDEAKRAGLVTNAMLEHTAAEVSPTKREKKTGAPVLETVVA